MFDAVTGRSGGKGRKIVIKTAQTMAKKLIAKPTFLFLMLQGPYGMSSPRNFASVKKTNGMM